MDEIIQIHACDGSYDLITDQSFRSTVEILEKNRCDLFHVPSEVIIKLLKKLGHEILKDPLLGTIPGLPYLSIWLREENIRAIYQTNFGHTSDINELVPLDSHHYMTALPRGIICHWIAGNIPFLGIFSLVFSLLGKNASILKVNPEIAEYITLILIKLDSCIISYKGSNYSGTLLTKCVAITSFSGKDKKLSDDFSCSADCRVIYGGEEAIRTISALPAASHCETIIFGPKYSFAIFDKETIISPLFSKMMDNLAQDIVLYNQAACSSPHVIFCETGSLGIRQIGDILKKSFKNLPKSMFLPLQESVAVSVINTRAKYLLDGSKDIFLSPDLSWTICISEDCTLEDAIQGRCIFLKPVDNLSQVLNLVTRKIQTVSVGIINEQKRIAYGRELAYRGVDRIMTPGTMHEYTQPWDGILSAGRMVRWVTIRKD